ncbi:hypothetical protein BN2475_140048 [Paraburkholderia ribeironis]|uniref:Uncharacterized protein n=1 Tax=Paraburkholderia ribeironis TaxID=1247936 RepID=A0A1N7RST9_9BURK|nr:hypothetical protein [Paraburkholderia ribeironis]SIT38175.1 hypothetical protein BN2475_140048 [Paraburkholderia ribeironis]
MRTINHHAMNHGGPAAVREEECFIQSIGGAGLLTGEFREACIGFCERNRDLVLSCLPGSLADVVRSTSFATMLDLVTAHGGRRLYLPTRHKKFFQQTGLFVPETTYKQWRDIADVNGQIYIPSVWGLFLALRRAAIRTALAREWPPEVLHSTFGISRRQIKAYLHDEHGMVPS